ncbi:MAG: PTS sugar transporter subunit IIA [Alphaproteobacteria bacterium]|nr:PTS sugar transporter subunit IIA [Alphaproteobacteria bacterium]
MFRSALEATVMIRCLSEEGIALDLATKGKHSALSRIAVRIARRSGLDEQLVLRGLWRSECLGSTGIGRGVAIPHALFDMISSPVASFTRLMPAIDFGGPDDDPVDIVYTLLWPRSAAAAFLPALSQVRRVLRAVRTREELRQAHSADEVMAIPDAAPSSGISISSHTHRAGRVVMSTQLSNG